MANVNLDMHTGEYEVPGAVQTDIAAAAAALWNVELISDVSIMDGIEIPMEAAVKGHGLANGFVVLTRTTHAVRNGKTVRVDWPVAFIPINAGHRFPTRFAAGRVEDEHGNAKLDRAGHAIVKKMGIQKFFATVKPALVKAVYEAVPSGEWAFHLVYNKIVK